MALIEGDTVADEDADVVVLCSMPGIEESLEEPEEPQAARASARAVAVPAAARARRCTVEQGEANIKGGLSGWAHHAGWRAG